MLGRKILLGLSICMAVFSAQNEAMAGKEDDTLIWASEEDPGTVDFYYNAGIKSASLLAITVWDTLLVQDLKTGTFLPHLAETFEFVDPQTIDVTLRKGIKFHNGEKFDADDVVFTLNYVVDPANKVRANQKVSFIKSAEKTGEYSARIHLKGPFPAAKTFFAIAIPIYPNEYYAKVGPEGMAKAPIGTGAYKIDKIEKGKQIVFSRNEEFFGGARPKPSIKNLIFRPIPERATQVAELMTGGIDWAWNLLPDQAKSLKANPDLTVTEAESIRIGFLKFDAAGVTGENPFQKLEVRQAISHAVDRQAIVDNLVGKAARVIHAPCFPEQFACEDRLAKRYNYDPALAKKLMADAGYANGFTTDIYACRDRPYVEAVIGYLSAIKIKTNLRFQSCDKIQELTEAGQTCLLDVRTWIGRHHGRFRQDDQGLGRWRVRLRKRQGSHGTVPGSRHAD